MILREAFDYLASQVSPTGPHIDPCHVAVYEMLVVKGADWRAHPGLARSWEISEDGLEWRFHLNPSARFHSGERCTAGKVIAPLEHLRWDFPGGQLWYWDPVDEMSAEGDDTVVFRLHYPYSRLPSLLWGTHSTIYNETARAADPDRFGFDFADGTGPFQLASWSPERVVVERFSGYAGRPPALDGIEWLSILDPAERLAALERGDVDVLHGPPLSAVDRLLRDDRFVVVEHPQASSIYLALDFEQGFSDRSIRAAASLAVDREALVREALAGRGFATWGAVPPGDEHYDPGVDAGRGRDLERARELMAGREISCDCLVQDDAVIGLIGRLVAEQLREIGIHLELRFEKPFAPFYDEVSKSPPAFVSKWLWPDCLDAVIGFASSRCDGFPNWQHAAIPELDAAFEAWLRAGPPEELQAAASKAQRIAADELPYVPLVAPTDIWVHTRRLEGFVPYAADLYPRYNDARLT
jgi:ABC-type transport system substrate-binding protein